MVAERDHDFKFANNGNLYPYSSCVIRSKRKFISTITWDHVVSEPGDESEGGMSFIYLGFGYSGIFLVIFGFWGGNEDVDLCC